MHRGQATALQTALAATALAVLGLLIPLDGQAGPDLPAVAAPAAAAQPLAALDSCVTDHGAGMLGLVQPTASRKRPAAPKPRQARRHPQPAPPPPPQAEAPAEPAPMVYRTFLSCIGPSMEEMEILHSSGASGPVRRT